MIRMSCVVEYPIVFIFLCNLGAGKSGKTYEKCATLSIFNRLGHFPQVCRKVKKLLLLKLHEVIRVPICFCFMFGIGREGCSKL